MSPGAEDVVLRDIGEFALHEWLSSVLPRHPADPVGLGDDCTVLDILPDSFLLLTTDRVPLSAYKRSYTYLGRLCVTHNFSDIICKGGTPLGLLLGTYMPRETRLVDWQTLILAARDWAAHYGAHILGGDTKEAPNPSVVGCAVGVVEKRRLLRRVGAEGGDVVAISLTSGSRIGLPWLYILATSLDLGNSEEEIQSLEAAFMLHNLSLPLKETLAANADRGITSCADSSDGIGGALQILATCNGAGVRLEYDALISCLHESVFKYAQALKMDPVGFCFTPGYVWENVFTIRPEAFEPTRRRVRDSGGDLVQVGTVMERSAGFRLEMPSGEEVSFAPFFNEGFRSDRSISNSTEAWLQHRFFL